jgi:hypothetical protein
MNNSFRISEKQIHDYNERGHVKLDSVMLEEEVSYYRKHINLFIQNHHIKNSGVERLVQGQQEKWIYISNIWRLDMTIRSLILMPLFGELAAKLLNVPTVRLFRDQTYFKLPGGSATPWHQDAYFMPLDTDRIVTMWLPLVEIVPEMGPMNYADGSQKKAIFHGVSRPEPEHMKSFTESICKKGFNVSSYSHFSLGDVAFHSGWTLHSAPVNQSNHVREVIVIVYYADGAHISCIKNASESTSFQEQFAESMRKETLASCFPGLGSGDLAQTEMNPIVFGLGR